MNPKGFYQLVSEPSSWPQLLTSPIFLPRLLLPYARSPHRCHTTAATRLLPPLPRCSSSAISHCSRCNPLAHSFFLSSPPPATIAIHRPPIFLPSSAVAAPSSIPSSRCQPPALCCSPFRPLLPASPLLPALTAATPSVAQRGAATSRNPWCPPAAVAIRRSPLFLPYHNRYPATFSPPPASHNLLGRSPYHHPSPPHPLLLPSLLPTSSFPYISTTAAANCRLQHYPAATSSIAATTILFIVVVVPCRRCLPSLQGCLAALAILAARSSSPRWTLLSLHLSSATSHLHRYRCRSTLPPLPSPLLLNRSRSLSSSLYPQRCSNYRCDRCYPLPQPTHATTSQQSQQAAPSFAPP
ncbi:hypothetical protein B296_00021233 [Ensete ventricosum]|uniref:Uncharacterized protein n=1 Tax=Ensete ventricosum TaxID=4639 RepID=A0A426ZEF7_ENSVE|nr:hypothetical protein B296_00021233 [Ensete ventricosum]